MPLSINLCDIELIFSERETPEKFRERGESNPGLLGEKRERYLCATPPPLTPSLSLWWGLRDWGVCLRLIEVSEKTFFALPSLAHFPHRWRHNGWRHDEGKATIDSSQEKFLPFGEIFLLEKWSWKNLFGDNFYLAKINQIAFWLRESCALSSQVCFTLVVHLPMTWLHLDWRGSNSSCCQLAEKVDNKLPIVFGSLHVANWCNFCLILDRASLAWWHLGLVNSVLIRGGSSRPDVQSCFILCAHGE